MNRTDFIRRVSTDSYIEIGNSHNICEDYALHGNINGEFPVGFVWKQSKPDINLFSD